MAALNIPVKLLRIDNVFIIKTEINEEENFENWKEHQPEQQQQTIFGHVHFHFSRCPNPQGRGRAILIGGNFRLHIRFVAN